MEYQSSMFGSNGGEKTIRNDTCCSRESMGWYFRGLYEINETRHAMRYARTQHNREHNHKKKTNIKRSMSEGCGLCSKTVHPNTFWYIFSPFRHTRTKFPRRSYEAWIVTLLSTHQKARRINPLPSLLFYILRYVVYSSSYPSLLFSLLPPFHGFIFSLLSQYIILTPMRTWSIVKNMADMERSYWICTVKSVVGTRKLWYMFMGERTRKTIWYWYLNFEQ